jgi:crossover junction endodeoxyribonuclease RusA
MYSIILPVPPSVNALYPTNFKTNRRFKSQKYKEWEVEAAKSVTERPLIDTSIVAKYSYTFKDKRRRDIANFEKAISDFLQKEGIITDDCLIDVLILEREEINKENPHVKVEIVNKEI